MEYIIIPVLAFGVAILTFFSGFGLGTILTPVFMVFFPVQEAIALTGVVHFFNNLFKVFLVGKHADKDVLIRFGIPAVISAFVGSWILVYLIDNKPMFSYMLFDKTFDVYTFKLVVAVLLIVFALTDIIPYFKKMKFEKNKLPVGGVMSGFFGGLTGNQGALRSAFLIKAGLSKEAFVGTAVVVSSFVDFTRLGVYASGYTSSGLGENILLVSLAVLAGIAGSFIGNKLLKKVTLDFVQVFVAVMLIILSVALGAGWL